MKAKRSKQKRAPVGRLAADFSGYLGSWAAELGARQNRVRMLIGDAHWLSDGHHKEAILRESSGIEFRWTRIWAKVSAGGVFDGKQEIRDRGRERSLVFAEEDGRCDAIIEGRGFGFFVPRTQGQCGDAELVA